METFPITRSKRLTLNHIHKKTWMYVRYVHICPVFPALRINRTLYLAILYDNTCHITACQNLTSALLNNPLKSIGKLVAAICKTARLPHEEY